ncbi:MAG: DUF2442 domain-containing protein [Bryobacteraceae bacterium]|nr:DUF2442 domain-containing protein [Bryobacteraceae bacterium]
MLLNVVYACALPEHRVLLRFEDGLEGVVDLGTLNFSGVFAPLANPTYFAKLRVDPDLGTIAWPNGADLDPDVLYSKVLAKRASPYTET